MPRTSSGGQPQEFGPAVGVAEQGWRVSGGGETGAVMGRVELGDQAAGEQSGVEVGQEAVGAGEQVSGGGLVAGGDVKAGDVGQGGGSRPVWTVWARVCWAS